MLQSMAVALQIKDVPEEVRDAVAARAAEHGQSMQVYLRGLLEREMRIAHNRRLFENLDLQHGLDADVDWVVDIIRCGREGDDEE
jgi:antitoxin FitA